jgi:hypothetical protein
MFLYPQQQPTVSLSFSLCALKRKREKMCTVLRRYPVPVDISHPLPAYSSGYIEDACRRACIYRSGFTDQYYWIVNATLHKTQERTQRKISVFLLFFFFWMSSSFPFELIFKNKKTFLVTVALAKCFSLFRERIVYILFVFVFSMWAGCCVIIAGIPRSVEIWIGNSNVSNSIAIRKCVFIYLFIYKEIRKK